MSQYPQLDSSILQFRNSGVSDEKIINDARAVGWSDSDISAAYATIGVPFPKVPVQSSGISNPTVVIETSNTPSVLNNSTIQNSNLNASPKSARHSYKKIILSAIVLVAVIATGAYMYSANMFSFFQHAPYSESNLVSGILSKLSEIKSSTYSVSASLYVEPRESDATPFNIKMTDDLAVKEKYMRDFNRSEDVSSIVNMLRYSYSNTIYKNSAYQQYPQSLTIARHSSPTGGSVNITDPLTNQTYQYSVNPAGDDFKLVVTFETPEAVEKIARYNMYDGGGKSTMVEGYTVTFSKTSSSYYSVSNKPPLNFFESMSQYAQYLPPEIHVDGSVTAASNIIPETNTADWKINLSADGDFGDLSYKINADALKKGKEYYLKISNIPSLFAGFLPKKGQWYKINPKEKSTTTDSYSSSFDLSETLADGEKSYSDMKQKNTDLIKKVAGFADEEKLFSIKESPKKEKVGDRDLYKYELSVNKEAVLPFYKKLLNYAKEHRTSSSSDSLLSSDESLMRYLESPQSSEVIEYYNKNTAVTVWVDDNGFLAALEYYVRVVPTDDATNLKDKQAIIKVKVSFDDINKAIQIDVPKDALDLDKENADSQAILQEKSNSASLTYKISNIRQLAEVVYSKDYGYGTKPFAVGPCKNTVGTLFADPEISALITSVNNLASSTAVCSSSLSGGSVSSYAVSIKLPRTPEYSYCVDNTGTSREILGSIKGSICK